MVLNAVVIVVTSLTANMQARGQTQAARNTSSQPRQSVVPVPTSTSRRPAEVGTTSPADSAAKQLGSESGVAWWITQLLALISGLFGGFGGVTIWEVVMKPRILRKRVGKVLEIEIGQNLSRMVHARVVRETHGKVRMDLKLSRL